MLKVLLNSVLSKPNIIMATKVQWNNSRKTSTILFPEGGGSQMKIFICTCDQIITPAKNASVWNISFSALRPRYIKKSPDICDQKRNTSQQWAEKWKRLCKRKAQSLTFQNQGNIRKYRMAESISMVTNSWTKWKLLKRIKITKELKKMAKQDNARIRKVR